MNPIRGNNSPAWNNTWQIRGLNVMTQPGPVKLIWSKLAHLDGAVVALAQG